MKKIDLEKQTREIIYGLAIGDALGVPVEFENRGSFHVSDMVGFGTYNQPPGTWSDDTSLTLALLEHLAEKSSLNQLMEKFAKYHREGYLTPYGECFDIGIATSNAIDRYLLGYSKEQWGGKTEWDNGNGALMRISPLALLLQNEDDFSCRVEFIEKYTQITHGHPRSILASIIYIQLLIEILQNKELKIALENVCRVVNNLVESNKDYKEEFDKYYRELFLENFLNKKEEEIQSTGYVVDTLKAAIWSLGNSSDYKSAVLKAVNLGSDTDTVGAITGTLAGAMYGLESIPFEWIDTLASKEIIDKKINAFVETY